MRERRDYTPRATIRNLSQGVVTNVKSMDRIIYSIFQRFTLEWKTRTLKLFTQVA